MKFETYPTFQVLFRYAVAFFKSREEGILEQKDTMSIHRYLRELGDSITDIERITQVPKLLTVVQPICFYFVFTEQKHILNIFCFRSHFTR